MLKATIRLRQPVVRPLVRPTQLRSFNFSRLVASNNDPYEKREKTMEDKNVRDHEKKLIEDLQKQLKAKEQLLHSSSQSGTQTPNQLVESLRHEMEDRLLELRTEILNEVREVDDKIAELKYRIQRLEKQLKH